LLFCPTCASGWQLPFLPLFSFFCLCRAMSSS
jgi:hypothetical protein